MDYLVHSRRAWKPTVFGMAENRNKKKMKGPTMVFLPLQSLA
jgi:hypothetical protein